MIGVFDVQTIGIVFFMFIVIIALFYFIVNKRTRRITNVEKIKPYMCGEEPKEEATMPHRGFYKTVVSGMKFRWLRKIHSGNVSDYVLAIVIGVVFMFMMMVFWW